MPSFFSAQCQTGTSGAASVVAACDVQPIVAVAKAGGFVEFFQDQGELVCEPQKFAADAVTLEWSPTAAVLAIGLSNGATASVSFRSGASTTAAKPLKQSTGPGSDTEPSRHEDKPGQPHMGRVAMVRWSPDGSRVVTGDTAGTVAVWRPDAASGRLFLVHTYRKSGVAGKCCFLTWPGSKIPGLRAVGTPGDQSTAGGTTAPHIATVPAFGTTTGCVSMLCATDNGTVFYCDDAGRCIDVISSLHSPVDVLEHHDGTVVVITRALLMAHLGLHADGKVTSLLRAKVSMKGSTGVRHSVMTNTGILCTATSEEPFIRCWDISASNGSNASGDGGSDNTGSTYFSLSITASGRAIPRHERIQALSYSRTSGMLAAGTDSGQIYLWRQITMPAAAGAADASSASAALSPTKRKAIAAVAGTGSRGAWEPIQNLGSAGAAEGMSIGHGGAVIAVKLATGDVISIVSASMRRKLVAPISIIQLSNKEVAVERKEGPVTGRPGGPKSRSQAMVVRVSNTNGGSIKGCDATDKHVLIWTGRSAEVYAIPDGNGYVAALAQQQQQQQLGDAPQSPQPTSAPLALKMCSSFKTTSVEMAISGDQVFACSQQGQTTDACVTVHNMQGTLKHTIALGAGEGYPTRLDTCGRSLAIATSTGHLRVYDVSRAEPQLVASGSYPQSGSAIERLRVNSDGSRVAVLVATSSSTTAAASAAGARNTAGSSSQPSPTASSSAASAGGGRDSRVHVYSCESDAWTAFEFGPRQAPSEVCWDGSASGEGRLLAVQVDRIRAADQAGTSNGSSSPTTAGGKAGSGGDGKQGDGKDADDADDDAGAGSGAAAGGAAEPDVEMVTLFVISESDRSDALAGSADQPQQQSGGASSSSSPSPIGLVLQDRVPLEAPADALLGLHVPYAYTLLSNTSATGGSTAGGSPGSAASSRVLPRILRDFEGMDNIDGMDEATRKALVDFSFHMARGAMDAAYSSVKSLPGDRHSLWENMASMCVKSGRLDVARVCLGHMGHARGARAVRELAKEPEPDANVALVAIQLGLLNDAARLYTSAGRPDLLVQLYQDGGQWDKAQATAKRSHRIGLKGAQCGHGKHLEACGDVAGATAAYEAAGVAHTEVTRMLHQAKDFRGLQNYVESHDNDLPLQCWYGQYLEAQGNPQRAIEYYKRGNDHVSVVRLACLRGDIAFAANAVSESGNSKAAAYHLARHLEQSGQIGEALRYYEQSGRFNHAVRLATSSGTDVDLMNLALQADTATQLQAARSLESKAASIGSDKQRKETIGRAATLYHRAGATDRALQLCFSHGLFEELRSITDDLGNGSAAGATNPAVLARCAEFFVSNGHFEKAASLLINAKRYDDAIDMCLNHKVTITEAMAEQMTPPRPEGVEETPAAKDTRISLLLKLAQACKRQGSYHLATKKYTQAGDKVKALKALLKSGDTEKIVFFAQVSRSKEIYVLAANYLQSLPWHADAEVLKNIIDFYSKARAYEQLSSFYEACSAVEIDEYRNYEKALAALREAGKQASKIVEEAVKEARLAALQGRIALVERFVTARKLAKTDTNQMVQICMQLLEQRDAEGAIRVGDVFALLIYFQAQQRQWSTAHGLIESMRSRGIPLGPFIDATLIESIYTSVGIDPRAAGVLGGEDDGGDGIDEEIEAEGKQ